MKRKFSQEEVWALMHGRIYINKYDTNIFVKRHGGVQSWTMNLGNIWSWVIQVIMMTVILTIVWGLI